MRVAEGGRIKQRILLAERGGVACCLGGPQGRTLFLLCAQSCVPEVAIGMGEANAFVASVQVGVAAARSDQNEDYCAGYC